MKVIENFTVLNTWDLLVDFLNEHWFIFTATSTEIFIRAFMVQRFCDTDNESAEYKAKRAFNPNFPNFPAIRPKVKFFEPLKNLVSKRAKLNVHFENKWLFRKNIRE